MEKKYNIVQCVVGVAYKSPSIVILCTHTVSISRFPNSSTSSFFKSCLFNLSLCTLYTSISTSSISHFVNLSLCKYITFSILISSTVTLLILNFDKVGFDKMRSLHMGNWDDPSHAYKCKPHEVYYATTSDENFTGHR